MIDPHTLLSDLANRGVRITNVGGKLHVDAPAGVLTPELREAIRTAKSALLAILNRSPAEQFAISDAEATAGLKVYSSADDPLPTGSRDEGLHALILCYSARRRVKEWIGQAANQPLDSDLLRDVESDLRAALAMLELKAGNKLPLTTRRT